MSERKSRRIPLDLHALSGREEIFRIGRAVKRDSAIDSWFKDEPVELRSIAKKWFERMRRCGADVRELIHDNCPVVCVEDAPFGYVNTFKSHASVGFFHGAALDDPARLLQGSGKRMRHVKLTPDSELDAGALNDLIHAAYIDIKTRLDTERTAKNE